MTRPADPAMLAQFQAHELRQHVARLDAEITSRNLKALENTTNGLSWAITAASRGDEGARGIVKAFFAVLDAGRVAAESKIIVPPGAITAPRMDVEAPAEKADEPDVRPDPNEDGA